MNMNDVPVAELDLPVTLRVPGMLHYLWNIVKHVVSTDIIQILSTF